MNKSIIYTNSKDEWYTPKEVFEYAREVMGGGITLDPATTKSQAERLGVKKYYTIETNGLNQKWENDTIWLNPPFSNKIDWIKKAREAVDKYNCKVIMLLPASLETKVFQEYILGKAILHIPNKRISFINENGVKAKGASFTSILVELTKEPTQEYKLFKI